MAETKRNSVAGKVATPKAGSPSAQVQPLGDTLEALGRALGARVKITTVQPDSKALEGTLYTADPFSNLVAINTRPQPSNVTQAGDYHILPVAAIQNFQILAMAENHAGFAAAQPSIGPVDTKRLAKREADRIRQLKEQERDRNPGVSADGQAIFDALKRINMPVRWHEESIIAHDAVIISPPYAPENCRCPKDKQEALSRVKKALEGERRKLQEKAERERKNAAPRKGG